MQLSIHNLGLVGHIEDIAVAKDQQGKKLGQKIIEALSSVAEIVGCYKVSPIFYFFVLFVELVYVPLHAPYCLGDDVTVSINGLVC